MSGFSFGYLSTLQGTQDSVGSVIIDTTKEPENSINCGEKGIFSAVSAMYIRTH